MKAFFCCDMEPIYIGFHGTNKPSLNGISARCTFPEIDQLSNEKACSKRRLKDCTIYLSDCWNSDKSLRFL